MCGFTQHLQHIRNPHKETLQHVAAHCNILQHTATYCNKYVDLLATYYQICADPDMCVSTHGVATISRLLQIIGLFCKRAL